MSIIPLMQSCWDYDVMFVSDSSGWGNLVTPVAKRFILKAKETN